MRRDDLRNIVIIAHVDHGKTSLVDCLLRQSNQFRDSELKGDQILDSNDLERERGITILAKNIALPHKGLKINIIDTPGHADFGGEVERVLQMADGALLLVDAAEGPMPQTRFVLTKALEAGLRPIIVVNKIDRPDARALEAADEAFELLLELGGDDIEELPHIFSSAKEGIAKREITDPDGSILQILDMVVENIPGPEIDSDSPLSMRVTTLDWSEFVGRIAVGKLRSGVIRPGPVAVMQKDGTPRMSSITQLYTFDKLGRTEVEEVSAGDVVALVGLGDVEIGDTICNRENLVAQPRLTVDEPTLEMVFSINSSPLAGKVGKYVTTRQVRERLVKELDRNVALRVRPQPDGDGFYVAGRGVLHLSVLIETMRREGYELSVGKPHVIFKEIDGKRCEPYETLVVEVPNEKVGPVMELVGARRGQLDHMDPKGAFTHITFSIPARGLIGLKTRMLNATQGEAMMHHRFAEYRPTEGELPRRSNGVLISTVNGKAVGFALDNLQQRAELFVKPGDVVYEGMVVGENARNNDMPVNPTKEKKLTNIRASGSDDNILLKPPRQMTLEESLEYIEEDELVEITPADIRIRKMLLREHERNATHAS